MQRHHHGVSIEKAAALLGELSREHESHAGYEMLGTDDGGSWSGYVYCPQCSLIHTIAVDNEEYQEALSGAAIY
jgi:hypothetical protein